MRTLLILILTVIIIACEVPKNENQSKIFDSWSLISIGGGFFQPEEFNIGDIIWVFETNELLVVYINISLSNNSKVPLHNDGVYDYILNDGSLTIKGVDYSYYFVDKLLVLTDDPAADGPIIKFSIYPD